MTIRRSLTSTGISDDSDAALSAMDITFSLQRGITRVEKKQTKKQKIKNNLANQRNTEKKIWGGGEFDLKEESLHWTLNCVLVHLSM